jgi:hypothetical protein
VITSHATGRVSQDNSRLGIILPYGPEPDASAACGTVYVTASLPME